MNWCILKLPKCISVASNRLVSQKVSAFQSFINTLTLSFSSWTVLIAMFVGRFELWKQSKISFWKSYTDLLTSHDQESVLKKLMVRCHRLFCLPFKSIQLFQLINANMTNKTVLELGLYFTVSFLNITALLISR